MSHAETNVIPRVGTAKVQSEDRLLQPSVLRRAMTHPESESKTFEVTLSTDEEAQHRVIPPIAYPRQNISVTSTPLQIWQGTVVDVDASREVIYVLLDAKIGQLPQHTGEIDFESISAQDWDLVRPGAVFYLTQYKKTIPSVENIQELRFRRRPSWSADQLRQVAQDAELVSSKIRAAPRSK